MKKYIKEIGLWLAMVLLVVILVGGYSWHISNLSSDKTEETFVPEPLVLYTDSSPKYGTVQFINLEGEVLNSFTGTLLVNYNSAKDGHHTDISVVVHE